jgi:hypothetical protein
MANDFKKKLPTKNEQMLYEVAMHIQEIEQRLWSVSSHMLALGAAMNVDPKKMAEMLTGDDVKLKDYAQKINEEIAKIEAVKKESAPQTEQKTEQGQVAPHDHSHDGHDHAGHTH